MTEKLVPAAALGWVAALMHSAWHNESAHPRAHYSSSWVAEGVSVGGMEYDVARFGKPGEPPRTTPRHYRLDAARERFPQLR